MEVPQKQNTELVHNSVTPHIAKDNESSIVRHPHFMVSVALYIETQEYIKSCSLRMLHRGQH